MIVNSMYVDGRAYDSGETTAVYSPATDEVLANVQAATLETAQIALESAKEAQISWGKASVKSRIEWMNKLRQACIDHEEQLRMCVHLETGKTWEGTQEDYQLLIDSLEFYAQEITRFQPDQLVDPDGQCVHTLRHKPVGVVVAYLSWNFPLLNLGYKLGPAMASGCPIILKPSIQSPLSAYLVGDLCRQVGLPKGAVTIISGGDRDVSDLLTKSKVPAMITLIGSIPTGVKIMATGATNIKRYSMELGGNTPFIVFNDADLDKAADILTALKYGNSGQICVAPNRVFVESQVHDEFLAKVLERTAKVKLGFGRDTDATMGPLINKKARAGIHNLVMSAVEQGATLHAGGELIDSDVGAFYPPTVVTGVHDMMEIYREELFGPVISMIRFEGEDYVTDMANDTDTGLASYVFTQDHAKAKRVSENLEFGEVQINGVKYAIELPHVGIKQSGIGCDCSKYALNDYLYLTRETHSL
ncbi:aldehyde dehydrogenase family protein [Vibrio sp. WXL210]|uniref:aldehyde dehydrogenase family protein n=1 Tax=Vibrio sp. WXL210 TaxID=3450709 RepID=UPI003EC74CD1